MAFRRTAERQVSRLPMVAMAAFGLATTFLTHPHLSLYIAKTFGAAVLALSCGGLALRSYRRHRPRSWLACALAVAIASPALFAFAQQGDAEEWGNAVDGIELHLEMSSDTPASVPSNVPIELSRLAVAIRNVSKATIPFSDFSLTCAAAIEVDGVWFGQVCFGNGAENDKVAPGESSRTLRLSFQSQTFEVVESRKPLVLTVGKHLVRVRENVSSFAPNMKVKNRIVLSNKLTITVFPH